jgi:transcriptional regulator with XRE-family HTH domain
METTASFGYWVRRQRKALDLTQQALADRVGCSPATLKKIEADERRPSRQMAERLADYLAIPAEQRELFIECARGLRPVDHLPVASEVVPTRFAAGRSNLPAEATPFSGRTAELSMIAGYLRGAECRLLTLVGTGGVDKTRLAIQAAMETAVYFAHGVCYMPLAAVLSPDLVVATILQQLDLPLSGAIDPEAHPHR